LPITPELRELYLKKIESMSAKERIVYHPVFIPTEKVARYFFACDIVILPYRSIYHSGVLHLAYSFGRPVIATKVGDFPETIEHGKSGYLLEHNDASCLSRVIAVAFFEPHMLLTMGEYVRHLSKEKYSWDAIAEKMKREYAILAE
jgi:D-inositol-3-phosphate glycosyltransferase